MRARCFVLVMVGLVAQSCAGFKMYSLPLTAAEGALLAPALVATSEEMGLRSFGSGNGAVTQLEDGTQLSWQSNGKGFVLLISLPGDVAEADRPQRWHDAKLRADQIWSVAVEARQRNNVGAAVIVAPGGDSAEGGNTHSGSHGARPAAPAGGGACRYQSDCESGQWCRQRADGVKLCMGNGGAGAPCLYAGDCGSGLFCRADGNVKVCR